MLIGQIPPAGLIEEAGDTLKSESPDMLAAQRHELKFALGDASPDKAAGYELGLQTARVMLAGMPLAVQHGVKI